MTDKRNNEDEHDEPVIRDKRRVDPETGHVREPAEAEGSGTVPERDGPSTADPADETAAELSDADQALLDQASTDLIAEMRSDMLRAQAELVNFRNRVERDRAANRDAVIAEVIRSLLPALDDLSRAEAHGDLVEGAPMTIVAQKLRSTFEKYGLRQVGEKGEPFDPAFHEAVVQLPTPDVTVNTIADVIEPGYVLGDRLVRPAKVAVSVPAE
ncbi:MAG: nucleotide exchange factor GrpE [Rhodoglobus sp.]